MAHRKTLAHRFFNMARTSCSRTLANDHPPLMKKSKSSQQVGCLPRFFIQWTIPLPDERFFLLPSIDHRIRELQPPAKREGSDDKTSSSRRKSIISMDEVKKVLKASQMEEVRLKLRLRGMEASKSCISYSEFLEICSAGDLQQGKETARALDDSGAVIVLGDLVFLHPHQVARAIESVIPLSILSQNDPRRQELEQMEEKKAWIDRKAEAQVRRELWCGLGFLLLQTAGFMRLTFWELSWDVMEPICFYVTSAYFMAGYFFFLRTSRDPSFEGFYHSRFSAKQKQLMRSCNFNADKLSELRKAFPSSLPTTASASNSSCSCCHRNNTLLGFTH